MIYAIYFGAFVFWLVVAIYMIVFIKDALWHAYRATSLFRFYCASLIFRESPVLPYLPKIAWTCLKYWVEFMFSSAEITHISGPYGSWRGPGDWEVHRIEPNIWGES